MMPDADPSRGASNFGEPIHAALDRLRTLLESGLSQPDQSNAVRSAVHDIARQAKAQRWPPERTLVTLKDHTSPVVERLPADGEARFRAAMLRWLLESYYASPAHAQAD